MKQTTKGSFKMIMLCISTHWIFPFFLTGCILIRHTAFICIFCKLLRLREVLDVPVKTFKEICHRQTQLQINNQEEVWMLQTQTCRLLEVNLKSPWRQTWCPSVFCPASHKSHLASSTTVIHTRPQVRRNKPSWNNSLVNIPTEDFPSSQSELEKPLGIKVQLAQS